MKAFLKALGLKKHLFKQRSERLQRGSQFTKVEKVLQVLTAGSITIPLRNIFRHHKASWDPGEREHLWSWL